MKARSTFALCSVLAVLASCSGGGGSSSGLSASGSQIPGSSISAQFIDAPVKGLGFQTASGVSGRTGNNGMFSCKAGELVTFKIHELVIGQSSCGSKIYIDEINTQTEVNKAAAILQSLTQESGGVLDLTPVLDSGDLAELTGNISAVTDTDGAIAAIVSAVDPSLTPKTRAQAREHVNQNLPDFSDDDDFFNVSLLGEQGITLSKTSGHDECYDKVTANVEVREVMVGDKATYRLEVSRYVAHDEGLNLSESLICDEETQSQGDLRYECGNPNISRIFSSEYPLRALSNYVEEVNYGYSFNASITGTNIVLNYLERGREVFPNQNQVSVESDHVKIGLSSESYECRYSFINDLDK